jgi:hypothetical protein
VFAQFSGGTTKQIDQINNNTQTDIILNPTSAVKVNNFTGSFVLESGASKELQESATTSTELGYLSGATSNIQTQIDSKLTTVDLSNDVTGVLPIVNGGTGSSTQTFVDVASDQVVGGVKNFSSEILLDHITTPANPIASKNKLYFKSDNNLYKLDSSGTESQVGGGGSSPITTEGDLIIGDGGGNDIRLPVGATDTFLKSDGTTASWVANTQPTIQKFTSGSGTYTTPANVLYIRVRMVGGGGGGSGGGSGGVTGVTGGITTFGTLTSSAGSSSGQGGSGPLGGTSTIGAGFSGTAQRGGASKGTITAPSANGGQGGLGGASPFGGNGSGSWATGAASSALANSGSGGGGGGCNATYFTGQGGSSGGYIDALNLTPAASYSYAIGAGGGGGAAGTGGGNGGNGGSGYIIVEEFY